MVMSTMLASVAEGMCLSDSLGLSNDALIEVQESYVLQRITKKCFFGWKLGSSEPELTRALFFAGVLSWRGFGGRRN